MTPKYTPEELRELMEFAAKAIGKKVIRWADDGKGLMLYGEQNPWNPADDDGDSFRLAMEALIDIDHNSRCAIQKFCRAYTTGYHLGTPNFLEEELFDREHERPAAARLAVLRVAAAIGRSMS